MVGLFSATLLIIQKKGTSHMRNMHYFKIMLPRKWFKELEYILCRCKQSSAPHVPLSTETNLSTTRYRQIFRTQH